MQFPSIKEEMQAQLPYTLALGVKMTQEGSSSLQPLIPELRFALLSIPLAKLFVEVHSKQQQISGFEIYA